MNPTESEWVHMAGAPARNAEGGYIVDGSGSPVLVGVAGLEGVHRVEACHNCRYNWDVRELIWDGEEQYTTTASGVRRRKTHGEFTEDVRIRLREPATTVVIPALVGVEL